MPTTRNRLPLLLPWFLAAVAAQNPLPPEQPPPARSFVDRFERDPRGELACVGEVTWRQGELVLAPSASVQIAGEVGPSGLWTLDADVGDGHGIVRVALRVWGAGELLVELTRSDDGTAVACLDRGSGGETVPVRSGAPAPSPARATWQIDYRHGLVVVRCDRQERAVAYAYRYGSIPVVAARVEAGGAPLVLRSLAQEVRPSPSAATEHIVEWRRAEAQRREVERLYGAGKFAAAVPLAEQCLATMRQLFGEDHPHVATAKFNLAANLEFAGDGARALALYREALETRRGIFGEDHPEYAFTLGNLAQSLAEQGRLHEAIRFQEHAVAVFERIYDAGRILGITHCNLGQLCLRAGEYARADAALQRAGAIFDALNSPLRSVVANSRAQVFERLGRAEDALREHERSLALARELHGPEHPQTISAMENLALALGRAGDRERAELLFAQLLELSARAWGATHRETARARTTLASFLRDGGRYREAAEQLREAIPVLRDAFGEGHPTYLEAIANLAALYRDTGSIGAAEPLYRQIWEHRQVLAEDFVGARSTAESLAFLRNTETGRDGLLSCMRPRHGDAAVARSAYEVVWRSSAMIARAYLAHRRVGEGSPEQRAIAENLRATRDALARLAMTSTAPDRVDGRLVELRHLTERKERLERELAAMAGPRQPDPDWSDLAAVLPEDTAVVHIVASTAWIYNFAKGSRPDLLRHYDAFVLRRLHRDAGDEPSVTWVPLSLADPYDWAIRVWRRALEGRPAEGDGAVDELVDKLRKGVWEKLEPQLRPCRNIVILPEGEFAQLPWAALPGARPGTYLLEEYAVSTAPDAFTLLAQQTEQPSADRALACVGGVDYGPASGSANGPAWRYLPGTARELAAVEAAWPEPAAVRALVGPAATEAAVRDLLPSARVAHLATHAFFADPAAGSAATSAGPEDVGLFGATVAEASGTLTGRNPLLLSGLVLAGANAPNGDGVDDGVLTGEEVAVLDLRRTDLVVLSACETGLGLRAGAEGLFGLQRAFHLAGARTVVASLWRIDDDATAVLMGELYRGLLVHGLSKGEALRRAQLTMLDGFDPVHRSLRSRGRDPEAASAPAASRRAPPKFWAAFVLSGAWR